MVCPGTPGAPLRLRGSEFFTGSEGHTRTVMAQIKISRVIRTNPDNPNAEALKMIVKLEGDDVVYIILQDQASHVRESCSANPGR
jgi:hypothetical protein